MAIIAVVGDMDTFTKAFSNIILQDTKTAFERNVKWSNAGVNGATYSLTNNNIQIAK